MVDDIPDASGMVYVAVYAAALKVDTSTGAVEAAADANYDTAIKCRH